MKHDLHHTHRSHPAHRWRSRCPQRPARQRSSRAGRPRLSHCHCRLHTCTLDRCIRTGQTGINEFFQAQYVHVSSADACHVCNRPSSADMRLGTLLTQQLQCSELHFPAARRAEQCSACSVNTVAERGRTHPRHHRSTCPRGPRPAQWGSTALCARLRHRGSRRRPRRSRCRPP